MPSTTRLSAGVSVFAGASAATAQRGERNKETNRTIRFIREANVSTVRLRIEAKRCSSTSPQECARAFASATLAGPAYLGAELARLFVWAESLVAGDFEELGAGVLAWTESVTIENPAERLARA